MEVTPLGLSIGAVSPTPVRQLLPGRDGVPAQPTSDSVRAPTIPSPPKLPESLEDFEAAKWLLRYYRGAVESRYRTRCYVLAQDKALAKSPYLPMLVGAAKLLREYDVAPAAWVAWSVDVWKESKRKASAKPPPLKFVFSENRIVDRHGWFESEAGAYDVRKAIVTDSARELRERWAQLWGALLRSDRSDDTIRRLVAQVLPPDEFNRLQHAACEEGLELQVKLNRDAASGRWLGW